MLIVQVSVLFLTEKKIKTKILSDLLTSHVVQPLLKESYPDVAVKLYDNCLFQVRSLIKSRFDKDWNYKNLLTCICIDTCSSV